MSRIEDYALLGDLQTAALVGCDHMMFEMPAQNLVAGAITVLAAGVAVHDFHG